MNQQPTLKALEFLIGKWHTTGQILPTDDAPAMAIEGTDSYEWALDGAFIIHRVDVMMGNEKVESIELIGNDKKSHNFVMRSFDKQGNFTEMKADLDTNGIFTIHGEGIRSHSTLSTEDDRQILKVIWEKQDAKSKWMPWLDMRLRK